MPMSDRELFARLIRCEAEGEGIDGMQAVATVVMNRVHVPYGEYLRTGQGNLRRVIEQPYQFTCMLTRVYGQDNLQNVYNIPAEQIHYEIADWALAGNKHPGAGDCLWYMNPFSEICPRTFPRTGTGTLFNRINQHCFYTPTSLYAQT
ncbi:MAG TPA: cell wall hydrolase [Clostridiaceae bacterium]|nr:cell wall hydrolase [Clostridiaceae bacterium]